MQNKLTSKTPQNTERNPKPTDKQPAQSAVTMQNTGKFVDSRHDLGPEDGKN